MKINTNFSFLEKGYLGLMHLAILAERNCYSDPNTTLAKLRILTEKFASILIDFEQLEEPSDNKQMSRLAVLANNSDTPTEIISIFHTLRKKLGSKAYHRKEASEDEACFRLQRLLI